VLVCELAVKNRGVPVQVLVSQVANRVLAIRLVQWLGWVFETQERKKETNNVFARGVWGIPGPPDPLERKGESDSRKARDWGNHPGLYRYHRDTKVAGHNSKIPK